MRSLHLMAFLALAGLSSVCNGASEFDLLITHGRIIDGTGAASYAGDVAVKDAHIVAVGNVRKASAKRRIDARGMVVAPGFIDMLGQSEFTILVEPSLPSKIFQGITTEITGEGHSAAPLNDAMIKQYQALLDHYGVKVDWQTLQQYFERLKKQGMGINLGTYVGATSVREMILGFADRAPTAAELAQMQDLVADGMKQGARGLSTALQYPPAPYAHTDELIALAQTAAHYGGIYATHMRSEGNAETAALDETFRIATEAHIPVEIFHLKVSGKVNWGKAPEIIQRIEAARAQGVDVAADTYAYTAWQNSMSAFIPPWAHEGGSTKLIARLQDPTMRARIRKDLLTPSDSWDNEWLAIQGPEDILVTAVTNKDLLGYQGRRIDDIAKERHEDPIDTLCELLIKDRAATEVAVFGMNEADVSLILRQPWVSVDNDAPGTSPTGTLAAEHPHPRAYGTFPHILRKYVREEHQLTWEQAIHKFTALAAQRARILDRGVLKPGMWADIVVFDPNAIRDVATYENPSQVSIGMQYVLVNGVPVIDQGKMTGKLPGRVLYGPGLTAPQ
jgi:N-acyl-D-amino-acid deacylase